MRNHEKLVPAAREPARGIPNGFPYESSLAESVQGSDKGRGLAKATNFDLAQYARQQRCSLGEKVKLIAAEDGSAPDTVLLAFQSTLGGKTKWFSGLLYLTQTAAALDQVDTAADREIPMGENSYWVNVEWCSWDASAFLGTDVIRASSPCFKSLLQSNATQ